MKNRKNTIIFSVIAFFLLLASIVYALYTTYKTDFISVRVLLLLILVLLIVVLILAFIIFRSKKKALVVIGGILCLLLAFGLVFITVFYVKNAEKTAREKFPGGSEDGTVATETVKISIYMRKGDDRDLSADMTYGLLMGPTENNKKVIESLEEELNAPIHYLEYQGFSALLEALNSGAIDVIIYNGDLQELHESYRDSDELDPNDPENQISSEEGKTDLFDMIEKKDERQITVELPSIVKPSDGKIKKSDDKGQLSENDKENRSFIVLLSGIDTRTDEMVDKSRSDVNIIAVINPDSHQVLLVTTPRDYFVKLKFPDYISYKEDKLTHAGMYGVQVCMDTLGMLYDIDIDYYFRVNFAGFLEIVDALGGVTVNVEKEFSTTEYTFPEGPNELNGYKALSFVRNRFGIGDQARGRNQVAFVKAVIDKALSTDMLFNFNSILRAVEGSFETSMPYDLLSSLIREQLETGADWNIVTYAVTGFNSGAIPYSMDISVYVLEPDYETVDFAKSLMQKVLNGEIISQPDYIPKT